MSKEGWCIWITGLPGSGKSVVSNALVELLQRKGIVAQLLSSDALRKTMTPHPVYSLEERDTVYATLVCFAKTLTMNGVNVIIDATGNLRRYRDEARKRIRRFMEVYLDCSLEVCVEREARRKNTHHAPTGIYARALKGKTPTVPGMGEPYESPLNPEIKLDAAKCSPQQCAERIMKLLVERFS